MDGWQARGKSVIRATFRMTSGRLCCRICCWSREDSAHREHDLRAVFNGVCYIARTGNQWRFMPHDYPPWPAIFQQMQRWMRAGCFERLVEDTRILLREFAGRKGQPTACLHRQSHAAIHARERCAGLATTARNGARASKVHIAVDTLGHLLALTVTPATRAIAPRSRRLPKTCNR